MLTLLVFSSLLLAAAFAAKEDRWSTEKALLWERKVGYQAGFNFAPSTADNELEMFQADTYDSTTIDRELGWAQATGFNAARVFLHNILWDEDSDAFLSRLDNFLSIANSHGIKIMFVLFDSCWNANPQAGTQPEPIPGVHNSQWLQSPGSDYINNANTFAKLQDYVQGVVTRFKDDYRVLAWDVWNEPNNSGYSDSTITPLLQTAFDWIRQIHPSQPLTTPIWQNVEGDVYTTFQTLQLDLSDVISFHNYEGASQLTAAINRLHQYDAKRPIVCTEYMARTAGSTFEPHLGIMKDNFVHAFNWGLVSGRIQTIYPWSATVNTPMASEPDVWFHDVFRANGTAFNQSEVAYIQSVLLPKKGK